MRWMLFSRTSKSIVTSRNVERKLCLILTVVGTVVVAVIVLDLLDVVAELMFFDWNDVIGNFFGHFTEFTGLTEIFASSRADVHMSRNKLKQFLGSQTPTSKNVFSAVSPSDVV